MQKSIFRKIAKVLTLFLLGFVVLLLVASSVFYIKQDSISKKILSEVSQVIDGDITFESIDFNPFVQFPSLSLTIKDAKFFETSAYLSDSLALPIASISKIHGVIHLKKLFAGDLSVSKIIAEDGSINLVKYYNGEFNITRAIGIINDSVSIDSLTIDTIQVVGSKNLELNQISLSNISLTFVDEQNATNAEVNIQNLGASLFYKNDTLSSTLHTLINIEQTETLAKLNLNNQLLELSTAIKFDKRNKLISFDTSTVKLNRSEFIFSGKLSFKEDPEIDIQYQISDKDLNIFSVIIPQEGLQYIKKGSVFFNGAIKGGLLDQMPRITCYFGIRHFQLSLPDSSITIKDLNLSGHFNSGSKADFSMARIKLDTLYADLPDGFINASAKLVNFINPQFSYNINLSSNIKHLNTLLGFSDINSLSGLVSLSDKYSGKYSKLDGWEVDPLDDFILQFDKVNVVLPQIAHIHGLSGELSGNYNALNLNNITAQLGQTDLKINGSIHKVLNLIFADSLPVIANLHIQSEKFALPEFLMFDPRIGEGFPYNIKDVDLSLSVRTSKNQLVNSKAGPEILFEISQLNAEVENLLPYLEINQGTFLLTSRENEPFLKFNNFDIDIAGGHVVADMEMAALHDFPSRLNISATTKDLALTKIFGNNINSDEPHSVLDGTFFCSIILAQDKNLLFDLASLYSESVTYTTVKDTLILDEFNFVASDVSIKDLTGENSLRNLSSNIRVGANAFKLGKLYVPDAKYLITANNGEFKVVPLNSHVFGTQGYGDFLAKPFASIPQFQFNYSVNGFMVEEFVSKFVDKQMITGAMDLDFDLDFSGNQKDSILASLNGQLQLSGDSLLFVGLDFDKLIEKFKRSQKFNLVDLGAVVFAGPIGLAVTKGSDFTRIFIPNSSDSTIIKQFYTEWTVVNGKLLLNDVALTTSNNRIAASGWVDFTKQTLDVSVAVLDAKGCSILSQRLFGNISEPEKEHFNVFSSVIAPVTNLFEDAFGDNCEPFYSGKLPHPNQKKIADLLKESK